METYLDAILERHRNLALHDDRDASELFDEAISTPKGRSLQEALSSPGLSVIAEVKRKSPSKGDLNLFLDPEVLAQAYETGGASAISVLTDADAFGGSREDLEIVERSCSLPILRKDFVVDIRDIYDAKIMGAAAALLIVAALEDDQLCELFEAATSVNLEVLVEVHDEAELRRALDLGPTLIGVNQRDLHTFSVDTKRAERVLGSIPDEVLAVAESGIASPDDAKDLATKGFDAILVGESFVTSPNPARAVASFEGFPVGPRNMATSI